MSWWARAEGLSFVRTQTASAVHTHTVDLAAERMLLAEEMMGAVRTALREFKGPVVVYNFGDKDNAFEQTTLHRAPMSMRHDALTAAGIAFDKAPGLWRRTTAVWIMRSGASIGLGSIGPRRRLMNLS